MDNAKTGAHIKELRTGKCMTQKELANLLNITDKAVSKWERGLCAPDISLLEPLAIALNTSIMEILEGVHISENDSIPNVEEAAKNVVDYSKNEISGKTKLLRRKYLLYTIISLLGMAAIILFCIWWSGYFSIIDESISPDGGYKVTVYDKEVYSLRRRFESTPVVYTNCSMSGGGEYRVVYSKCAFKGIWWSPDSTKYVISLDSNGTNLILVNFDNNNSTELNIGLSAGIVDNGLGGDTLDFDDIWQSSSAKIDYQFLQWSIDGSAMLIYYSIIEEDQSFYSGYFWYNCEDGNVHAIKELDISG